MLKFGNISLEFPFFQAPLSGYSDHPMRIICRQYGAELTFSGLMLDTSAAYRKVLKRPNFVVADEDHPIGGQLLGGDPEIMARAAVTLVDCGFDMIDLNFACPVPKVLKRGRGGDLLNDPERASAIFRKVRGAIKCPITMKLRVGFDMSQEGQDNFWQICSDAVENGVSGLVIHGRTVEQRYRNKADWEVVYQVKREFSGLTVVGSGDIFKAEDVVQRLEEGGLDGIAIARGGIGNPWIFRDARALLAGKAKPSPPSIAEQREVITRHFEMVVQQYDKRKVVPHFRKYCVYYAKHHPQRKKLQRDLLTASTIADVREVIKRWYEV